VGDLGAKPGGGRGGPLADQTLALPAVLGARDVAAVATDEAVEGGPRFPVHAYSGQTPAFTLKNIVLHVQAPSFLAR
jgi:hypothetical protein